MIPKSLSASGLKVANECSARYKAEYIDYVRTGGSFAADFGTMLHDALENYVRDVYIDKKFSEGWNTLKAYVQASYGKHFKMPIASDPEWVRAQKLANKWVERTDFTGIEVLSVEEKKNFPVKTSLGDIRFNYIRDRFQKLADGTIEVVDYKTGMYQLEVDELHEDIQARAYGLASQLEYPDADRIFVTFDYLQGRVVTTSFSKNENRETYKWLRAEAEKIIATDGNRPPETVSPGCGWCVRKHSCRTLQKNIAAGGLGSVLSDPDRATDLYATLIWQKKGITDVINDLEEFLLKYAESEDLTNWSTPDTKVEISLSKRRVVDQDNARKKLGSEEFAKMAKLNVGDLDQYIESTPMNEDREEDLRGLMEYKYGEPHVKPKKNSPF